MVKRILYTAFLFFLIIAIQSCSRKKPQKFEGGERIEIPYNPNRFATIESFVSEITLVPLETRDDCLTGRIIFQLKVHNDLIYINSDMKELLVFDLNGKFIRKIGKMGPGPGEFIVVKDFIFTHESTIEILDFKKIESYSLDGNHLRTVNRFEFLGTDFHCNPDNFCRSFSSGYYLWGGITGPLRDNERLREKSSLMYRFDRNMKLDGAYFSTKYGDGGTKDRFRYYRDTVLVFPSSLNYNIYQINSNDSISIRYSFDFGKYGFDSSQDVNRKTISYDDYIRGINHFNETDRFLNFYFGYKRLGHNMIYSKVTGQSYILTLAPENNENEFRFWYTQAVLDDRLIALLDVYLLKMELERMSEANIKKWGLEGIRNLDDNANPVLIFYKIKL